MVVILRVEVALSLEIQIHQGQALPTIGEVVPDRGRCILPPPVADLVLDIIVDLQAHLEVLVDHIDQEVPLRGVLLEGHHRGLLVVPPQVGQVLKEVTKRAQ